MKNSGITLGITQEKVIRDKYLRDDPDVEAWLGRIAHNLSLAEVLYCDGGRYRPSGAGFSARRSTVPPPAGTKEIPATHTVLVHDPAVPFGEREKNFRGFMEALEKVTEESPEAARAAREMEEAFYDLMASFRFLPNSPTLMNAGRELQQLAACYVLPVSDSIEGIFDALKNQALIHKSGGGTGFSFGRLRPADDDVKSTRGIASGPLSFMKIFDQATQEVKQGGTRRGANMAILPVRHPDIRAFIEMKRAPGLMENFNISVGIDETFMQAVKDGAMIDLVNPRTGEKTGEENARELWELMAECAWETGDPGYVVLDRINASNSNPTPALGLIEATNPCGEQPLLPNEPCNLGSINLAAFARDGQIDFQALEKTVETAVHLLDNVIDLNHYPTPEIEQMAKGNRRIGLGVMGFAEMLIELGIPYASAAAVDAAHEVMRFISEAAYKASEKLARARGVFPNWKESIYDPQSGHYRGKKGYVRNCARTTIAPTGTIALAAGLQGSGIEPLYALAYRRVNAAGLDAIREGRDPEAKDVYTEVNPLFGHLARENGFFGRSEEALWKDVTHRKGSIQKLEYIPEKIRQLFATAHDVPADRHIAIQGAFQRFTDNAVSKTVNLAHDATIEDIRKAYETAYDMGCKGLTIYRDGSKRHQILTTSASKEMGQIKRKANGHAGRGGRRTFEEPGQNERTSRYYEKETGYGTLHVNIVDDENGPYRVFVNFPPIGTELSGMASVIGILLSKYLEIGGDPVRILKHLNSVKGDKPHGFGPNRVDSIPHAIGEILKTHLRATKRMNGGAAPASRDSDRTSPEKGGDAGEKNSAHPAIENGGSTEGLGAPSPLLESAQLYAGRQEGFADPNGDLCPKCYSRNVAYIGGCKEPTCYDCGWSNCS